MTPTLSSFVTDWFLYFGNASGISREDGLVVIKPSGVPYEKLKKSDLVVTDLGGALSRGLLRPLFGFIDTSRAVSSIPFNGGVAHTHSRHATAWAQACREIPCLGTTQADYFHAPCRHCAAHSSEIEFD